MKRPSRFCLLVLLLATTATFAAHAANLVTNPEFDDGAAGWSIDAASNSSGTMAVDTIEGLPDAPSLHLLGDATTTHAAALSTCIAIDASRHVDLHVFVKPASGVISTGVAVYSDAACATQVDTVASSAINATRKWQMIGYDDRALPGNAASVRVYVDGSYGPMGSVGDVVIDHVALGPTGTLPTPIAFQEGLTGTWYNAATSGQGFEFIISTPEAPGGQALLFGAWFTYDVASGGSASQRWYSMQAAVAPGGTAASVAIYRNTGGHFDAPPATTAEQIGSGTLTFFSCTSALFTYAIDNGPSGAVPLHPLLANAECDDGADPDAAPPSDFGFSGAWYDTATSGQGLMVQVDPADAQVFLGWYTYALDGATAANTSQRWLSAQSPYDVGATSMDLDVYATIGGVLDSDQGTVVTTRVGSATLTFTSCTTATFEYDITGGEFSGQNGTIDLSRLGSPLASCAFAP